MSRNSKRVQAQQPPPEQSAVADHAPPQDTSRRTANTEFVELPSRGLFYPEGHALHNQEVVEIRYMTARDEDILTSPALLRKGLAVDKFIQNILVNQDIKVSDLLIGDKSAIMIAARITGYGEEYETRVVCPECDTPNDHTFVLEDYTKYFTKFEQSENFELTPQGTFKTVLPHSGYEVIVKLLTSADEARIQKAQQMRQKNNLADSNTTDFLKSIIVSIDGVSDPASLNLAILDLPARDSRFLRKNYTALVPNVEMIESFECMYCGTVTEMEVPLEAGFFWPDF